MRRDEEGGGWMGESCADVVCARGGKQEAEWEAGGGMERRRARRGESGREEERASEQRTQRQKQSERNEERERESGSDLRSKFSGVCVWELPLQRAARSCPAAPAVLSTLLHL